MKQAKDIFKFTSIISVPDRTVTTLSREMNYRLKRKLEDSIGTLGPSAEKFAGADVLALAADELLAKMALSEYFRSQIGGRLRKNVISMVPPKIILDEPGCTLQDAEKDACQ